MTKKRITKRIMALVIATLMLVALAIPATAAPAQSNSGKITVHKYSGAGYGYESDDRFSGSVIPDGDTSHPEENGYTKLPGVGFRLYSLPMTTINTRVTAGDVITGYTVNGTVVTFTFATGTPTTVNVTGTAAGAQILTNSSGVASFPASGTLNDGYYLLVESAPLVGYDVATSSVIRIPLTAADGQSLNYDIHVYPKNISNKDVVLKQLGSGGAEPISKGDTIPFELLAKFKNDAASPNKVNSVNDLKDGVSTYGSAQIIDTLSPDLAYKNDVAVYWMANDGTLSSTALTLGSDYTVTAPGAAGAGGRVVTVTLTTEGIQKAIDNQYPGFGITLSADYIGGASAGATASTITNKMGAIIKKATAPTPPPVTETTIYAPQLQLVIDKVADLTGGTAMAGVEFMLLTTATPTVNYQSGTSLTDSTYTAAQKSAIAAQYVLDKNGVPVVGTTDGSGKVIFSNIPGYADATGAKVWVKETKTNAGYQLKSALTEVTYDNKATYATDTATEHWFNDAGEWQKDVSVVNDIEIINYEQGEDPNEPIFSLPLTGGAGTIAFTVAGIVVMLGAAVLIVRKRKA